jgi:predicted acyltransferase
MRLKALDVFRGITVASMILVNFPGSYTDTYRQLEHSRWHGCTFADTIFPSFLFIAGVTSHISNAARRRRGATDREIVSHILRRGITLIALGLFLSAFPFFPADLITHLRIPGVLQRIGVAYALGALICLKSSVPQQVGILAVILIGYWLAMDLYPLDVPDQTLAAHVDRYLLDGHLSRWTVTWDPLGVLSTLPAVATSMLGSVCGRWLDGRAGDPGRLRGLVAAGCVGMVAGLLWHQVFPINKNLWSSSYVLFTAGAAALCLSVCIWLVDVKRWERWGFPFLVFGINPIAAYVGSTMMSRLLYDSITVTDGGVAVFPHDLFTRRLFASWLAPRDASLAFATSFVLVWFAILLVLYRRGIVLKV